MWINIFLIFFEFSDFSNKLHFLLRYVIWPKIKNNGSVNLSIICDQIQHKFMILNLDFLRFQYFKESQDLQLVVGMIIVNPTPVSIIELHAI